METLSAFILDLDAAVRIALIPLAALGVVLHIYTTAKKRGSGSDK